MSGRDTGSIDLGTGWKLPSSSYISSLTSSSSVPDDFVWLGADVAPPPLDAELLDTVGWSSSLDLDSPDSSDEDEDYDDIEIVEDEDSITERKQGKIVNI